MHICKFLSDYYELSPLLLILLNFQHKPFMFIERKNGMKVFRGYLADLMYVIARRLGVLVRFYEVPDQRWGSKNEDGTWNGLVGEVMKREVC